MGQTERVRGTNAWDMTMGRWQTKWGRCLSPEFHAIGDKFIAYPFFVLENNARYLLQETTAFVAEELLQRNAVSCKERCGSTLEVTIVRLQLQFYLGAVWEVLVTVAQSLFAGHQGFFYDLALFKSPSGGGLTKMG